MSTGSIERAGVPSARGLTGKLALWMAFLRQRFVLRAQTCREDEMPDWIQRDIGWRDGPADAPRAVVEGWDRPAAKAPRRSR
ncbi:hypothetical protein [Aureimonas ureilytica]|uniref:hypothetical protein n=1 Tax=Aureimonas ureilytica TaxID=401562 RepID=UPI00036607C5|nr:hypothetical protein [Aureimonas ureilytica]